LSLIVLIQY